jgi:hypothetical protein
MYHPVHDFCTIAQSAVNVKPWLVVANHRIREAGAGGKTGIGVALPPRLAALVLISLEKRLK